MRTLDDLRQTLQDQAGQAPDGTGVIEGARDGAVRIRRRRRRIRTVAAACTAVVLIVGAPLVGRLAVDGPARAPDVAASAYRQPYELTVSLAASPYYFTMVQGTAGTQQFLIARTSLAVSADGDPGGTVVVHDPGTFDPAVLLRGEPVTVAGHAAYYVPSISGKGPGTPSAAGSSGGPDGLQYGDLSEGVGWQDPSGAWVTVSESGGRDPLLRLAGTVRLDPPVTARAPFQLGWIPGDLPVTFASSRQKKEDGVGAAVGLGAAADVSGSAVMLPDSPPGGTPVSITALPMDGIENGWGSDYADQPSRTVAGLRVWYSENDELFDVGDGNVMRVIAGTCGITITTTDRVRFPYETLARMVEGMTFDGCTQATNWPPIVP